MVQYWFFIIHIRFHYTIKVVFINGMPPLKGRNFQGNKNTGTGYRILSTAGPKLSFSSLWHLFLQSSFWTVSRMPCGKDEKAEIWHGVKNLWLGWHLSRILPGTFILLPSNLCMQKGLTSLQVLSLYQQLPISPLRSRFTIFCASLRSFKRCSPPIPSNPSV